MPQKARKLCSGDQRCPNFAGPRGMCAIHALQYERNRGTARERGYSRKWEREARRFKTLYPLCGMRPKGLKPVMSECYEKGRITPAEHVDHVVPHRQDPALLWDLDGNCQSLCGTCHSRKTNAGL